MFRVDQFDLPGTFRLFASRFDGREGNIVDMVIAVIIFLGGREDEPGTGDHPVDRFAGAVYTETSVSREMYQLMVRADGGIDA